MVIIKPILSISCIKLIRIPGVRLIAGLKSTTVSMTGFTKKIILNLYTSGISVGRYVIGTVYSSRHTGIYCL